MDALIVIGLTFALIGAAGILIYYIGELNRAARRKKMVGAHGTKTSTDP